jgi:fatty acid desaturase
MSNTTQKFSSFKHEKINSFRFLIDFLTGWIPIFIMIYLSEKISFWFYILALPVIINRQVSLVLLGHEGAHGLLAKNILLNNFLSRYLFHFPGFISHSHYKAIHLLHHRFVGTQRDPDIYLYDKYPMSFLNWMKTTIKSYLNGSIFYYFVNYFTELADQFRRLIGKTSSRDQKIVRSDFFEYIIFWFIAFLTIHHYGLWSQFFIYWIIPVVLSMPYIQFHNVLEHGVMDKEALYSSRTIVGNYFFIEALMPRHLNYHLEHHLNDRIPHYNLSDYSKLLTERLIDPKTPEFRAGLKTTLLKIFRSS